MAVQGGTRPSLKFNGLAETEAPFRPFQSRLAHAFLTLKMELVDRSTAAISTAMSVSCEDSQTQPCPFNREGRGPCRSLDQGLWRRDYFSMIDDEDDAYRPLPVGPRPVADEPLSSWLARHAAYYGVSGPFFANQLMLSTRNLSVCDHRLGLAQVARLSEKLRRDPIALIAMTFSDTPSEAAELISRNRVPQICRP